VSSRESSCSGSPANSPLPTNVFLLALFRAAGQENHQPVAISAEINTVSGAEIHLVFENAATDGLNVGQVSIRDTLERRCNFGGGLNVKCTEPLCEGASPGGADVLPHVEHESIITHTLVSLGDWGRKPVRFGSQICAAITLARCRPTWVFEGYSISSTAAPEFSPWNP